MQYRRLGKSGLKLSLFSFGSWVTFGAQAQENSAKELMFHAYEQGINFFDNAEVYAEGESERIMGNVLKKSGWGRDTFCVSSKVFWGGEKPTQTGLSRKHVFDACHAALKRLQVDYLDLYFCHRPDTSTPIEETVRAMHDLVSQGKVLYWGTSEWDARQISEAYHLARLYHLTPPTMEQPEYNLFDRRKVEQDYLPLYEEIGLGTTTWSPLASGVLTGKYSAGIPSDSRFNLKGYEWLRQRYSNEDGKRRLEKVRRLDPIARSIGASTAQLALAWCAVNPHVSTVILGASKKAQLSENLKALDFIPLLTPDVLAQIEAVVESRPEPSQDLTS